MPSTCFEFRQGGQGQAFLPRPWAKMLLNFTTGNNFRQASLWPLHFVCHASNLCGPRTRTSLAPRLALLRNIRWLLPNVWYTLINPRPLSKGCPRNNLYYLELNP